MQPLELSLAGLISKGIVTYEDALEVSVHPKELDRMLTRQMHTTEAARTKAGAR